METTCWPHSAGHFLAMGLLTLPALNCNSKPARHWISYQLRFNRPVTAPSSAAHVQHWGMVSRCRIGVAAIMLAAVLATLPITPAAAEPATTVVYPTSTSATRLTGYAFDACSAPPLATMQAWKAASPYQGVGVYIGGVSRSCAQPNLTAAWVAAASLQGWRIIPIYVGHQAPCTRRPNVTKFTRYHR